MQDRTGSMITNKQLIFIIIGAQIGTGIFSLPRVASNMAREDAWISILLGALVPVISLYFIVILGRRIPRLSFTDMSRALFGKYLGSLLIILFIAYVIFFESIPLRLFSEITQQYLLPRTPLSVILLMYTIAVVYTGSKGLRVIGRLNELVFYLLLVSFLVLFIPLGQGDYTNILPVGQAGFAAIFGGATHTALAFAGIEILLILYPLVTEQQKVLKAGMIALSITTSFYLAIMIICELVFGVSGLKEQLFPGLVLLKIVQVPILERLEFIFLFFWLGAGARPVINMIFAASLSTTQLFKLDEKKFLTYTLIINSLVVYILAWLPKDILQVFKLADYAGYAFYAAGVALPLLYLIMAFIKGDKVPNAL